MTALTKPIVHITIGGVHATNEPTVIRTTLGSCISACLFDPVAGIAGMNHFMLPSVVNGDDSLRFGVHAMDHLIGKLMRLGADRARFQAKVFGGGHVLNTRESDDSVPRRNVRFIREYLDDDGIPIVAEDLGGYVARNIEFDTSTFKVKVRKLKGLVIAAELLQKETPKDTVAPHTGGVTLFD